MKLRNKKTGGIVEVEGTDASNGRISLWDGTNRKTLVYNSLAELNEEWEDYEEPLKPYWYLNALDGEPMKCDLTNCGKSNFTKWSEHRKKIGNYFETLGEAKKALEKLKAWKRLKNAKFGIDEWRYRPIEAYSAIERDYKTISVHGEIKFSIFGYEDFVDDFKLLFGGEDE